jgi:hypothetical protein
MELGIKRYDNIYHIVFFKDQGKRDVDHLVQAENEARGFQGQEIKTFWEKIQAVFQALLGHQTYLTVQILNEKGLSEEHTYLVTNDIKNTFYQKYTQHPEGVEVEGIPSFWSHHLIIAFKK